MFCKYCGEITEFGQEKCPGCGRELPNATDGNGFWDIVGEPQKEEKPANKPVRTVSSVEEKKPKASFRMLWVLLAGVVLIGSLTISNVYFIKKKTELEKKLDVSISENERLQAMIDEMEGSESKEKQELDEDKMAPEALQRISAKEGITEQSCEKGFRNKDGDFLFEMEFLGKTDRFCWEKLESVGYVEIEFNQFGCSEKYGITVKNEPDRGKSVLRADGLTEASAGTYKCIAENDYGGRAESTVELILIESDNRDEDDWIDQIMGMPDKTEDESDFFERDIDDED